jgi:hypothetical protein
MIVFARDEALTTAVTIKKITAQAIPIIPKPFEERCIIEI